MAFPNYERQQDELAALESIFMGDYEAKKTTWNAPFEQPEFSIRIRATENTSETHPPPGAASAHNPGNEKIIRLHFTLPHQYPQAPPLVAVERVRNTLFYECEFIQSKVNQQTLGLVGSESVYELVEYARGILQSLLTRKSFYDEMVSRKQRELELESKMRAESELREKRDERLRLKTEERELEAKIRETLQKRLMPAKPTKSPPEPVPAAADSAPPRDTDASDKADATRPGSSPGPVAAPPDSLTIDYKSDSFVFQGKTFRCGTTSSSTVLQTNSVFTDWLVLVDGALFVQRKFSVSQKLFGAILRHCQATIRPVYASSEQRVFFLPLQKSVDVETILSQCGQLSAQKSLAIIASVLRAFSGLEPSRSEVEFSELTTSHIFLSQNKIVVDVCAMFGEKRSAVSKWLLKKQSLASNVAFLFVKMAFGASCISKYDSMSQFLKATKMAKPIHSFLTALASLERHSREHQNPPSGTANFVSPIKKFLVEHSTLFDNPPASVFDSEKAPMPLMPFVSQSSQGGLGDELANANSRFKSDFEQISFIGKGAFGSVVRARNLIDNHVYAIKIIKLSTNLSRNARILREVTTLSRLHHDYIIRYYQAWLEDRDCSLLSREHSTDSELDDDYTSEGSQHSSSVSSSSDLKNMASGESLGDGGKLAKQVPSRGKASEASDHSFEFARSESEHDFLSSDSDGSNDWLGLGGMSHANASHSSLIDINAQILSDQFFQMNISRDSSAKEGRFAKESKGQQKKRQFLYIQMEYCDNMTLQEVIDKNQTSSFGQQTVSKLSDEQIWRIFRQIIEGLIHIHAQGMIHRDLKPKNILMDAKMDVKIADFGLALVINDLDKKSKKRQDTLAVRDAHASQNAGTTHLSLGTSPDSTLELTSGVGTALYTSPEQMSGAKYNSKTDLYSLGIILFELCYPFRTKMERVSVLTRLRSKQVVFPSDFDLEPFRRTIEALLTHDADARPSALEILREYVPARIEEEYIDEAIRMVGDPSTSHYDKLINALFSKTVDKHVDFAYDWREKATILPNAYDKGPLKSFLIQCSLLRHAVEYGAEYTGFFIPVWEKADVRDACKVIDQTGVVCELPTDLTVTFARHLARNPQICANHMCRYAFGSVFKSVNGRLAVSEQFSFDGVSRFQSPVFDAQIVSFALQVVAHLSAKNEWRVIIGHAKLFNHLMEYFGFTRDDMIVAKSLSPRDLVDRITRHVKDAKMAEILHVCEHGDVEEVLDRIHNALLGNPKAEEVLSQTRELFKLLGILRFPRVQIVFRPLFTPNALYSDFCFAVSDVDHGKKGGDKATLAPYVRGGRYDGLIQRFSSPFKAELHSSGCVIDLSVLLSLCKLNEGANNSEGNPLVPNMQPTVCVYSYAQGGLAERFLVSEYFVRNFYGSVFTTGRIESTEQFKAFCKSHRTENVLSVKVRPDQVECRLKTGLKEEYVVKTNGLELGALDELLGVLSRGRATHLKQGLASRHGSSHVLARAQSQGQSFGGQQSPASQSVQVIYSCKKSRQSERLAMEKLFAKTSAFKNMRNLNVIMCDYLTVRNVLGIIDNPSDVRTVAKGEAEKELDRVKSALRSLDRSDEWIAVYSCREDLLDVVQLHR